MKYYIIDWTGAVLKERHGQGEEVSFDTFEDAWEYISATFSENDFDDLFVIDEIECRDLRRRTMLA